MSVLDRRPPARRHAFPGAVLCGFILAALAVGGPAFGQSSAAKAAAAVPTAPELDWRLAAALDYSPLEQRLLEAHTAGRLAGGDLLWAALAASGVEDEAELTDWRARWREIVERLRDSLPPAAEGRELADFVRGARVATDADATPSPKPSASVFTR